MADELGRVGRLLLGHLVESAMKALTELIGLIIALRTTLAGDHDTRRGHPREASKPDQLPAQLHQLRTVVA